MSRSQSFTKRSNPYSEAITALQWGIGSGVVLASCYGMAHDMLSSIGVNFNVHPMTGVIIGAIVAVLHAIVSREMRTMFTFILIVTCAIDFAMVQHQFRGEILLIGSIIAIQALLLVVCHSLEKVWY